MYRTDRKAKLFIFDKASGKDKLIDWCPVSDPFPEDWYVPLTITERYVEPAERSLFSGIN